MTDPQLFADMDNLKVGEKLTFDLASFDDPGRLLATVSRTHPERRFKIYDDPTCFAKTLYRLPDAPDNLIWGEKQRRQRQAELEQSRFTSDASVAMANAKMEQINRAHVNAGYRNVTTTAQVVTPGFVPAPKKVKKPRKPLKYRLAMLALKLPFVEEVK